MFERTKYLCEGNDAVTEMGASEYFNVFFDVLHVDDILEDYASITTLTLDEKYALIELTKLMDTACISTSSFISENELIETGWPEKIRPIAKQAYDLFLERGPFREDVEEWK